MTFTFDLEKMFPTEDSRFSAYRKWIIISSLCAPVFRIVFEFLEKGSRVPGWLYLLGIAGLVFGIISLYISIYIIWKAKVIHAVLRMILGIIIGMFLSFITFGLAPIVALVLNWSRLKKYRETNGRFVKDQLILNIAIPLFCFLIGAAGAILSFVSRSSGMALIMIVLTALFYFFAVAVYTINVFDREREAGNTFYNTIYSFMTAGFVLIFCIFALTASIHNHIFDGDGIIHDITNPYDPTMAGTDAIVTPTPDFDTTHIMDIPSGDPGLTMATSPDFGSFNTGTIDLMHHPDISHADFSATDINMADNIGHPDMTMDTSAFPHYSAFDVFPDNLANAFDGTSMVGIPQIQQHPYMIFGEPAAHSAFQICDPSGMPQMSVSDGNILSPEGVTIGHIHTDPVSGTTIFTDINDTPLYSVDSHGQMFSDHCYIGHTNTSGNVTTISDMHDKPVARYDKLTKTWFDKMSKPISQIKLM